jgi:predicted phage tail protein
MAQIQITDLNPSDFGFMEELTEEELLAINGGGWFNKLLGGVLIFAGFFTTSVGIGVALIGAGGNIIAADIRTETSA